MSQIFLVNDRVVVKQPLCGNEKYVGMTGSVVSIEHVRYPHVYLVFFDAQHDTYARFFTEQELELYYDERN